jgi:hypothetical protein
MLVPFVKPFVLGLVQDYIPELKVRGHPFAIGSSPNRGDWAYDSIGKKCRVLLSLETYQAAQNSTYPYHIKNFCRPDDNCRSWQDNFYFRSTGDLGFGEFTNRGY